VHGRGFESLLAHIFLLRRLSDGVRVGSDGCLMEHAHVVQNSVKENGTTNSMKNSSENNISIQFKKTSGSHHFAIVCITRQHFESGSHHNQ
jgi:hypothetical protein